jgi:hypothetical protein
MFGLRIIFNRNKRRPVENQNYTPPKILPAPISKENKQ